MDFIINYNKWHHGGSGTLFEHGDISMLNDDGYSCCLGLCALQMEIPPELLLDYYTPDEVSAAHVRKSTTLLNFLDIFTVCDDDYNDVRLNNKLTDDAVAINDNESLTIKQRIDRLVTLFKEHNHSLKFINLPEE